MVKQEFSREFRSSALNPLNHPICFSYPKRTASSAWLAHIPFGMYLVDLLRPRVIVELGTHTGTSYCAFCQAVKELGIHTQCYAIDTWQGDPQAGSYGSEVLEDLRRHHDPLYGSFSQLVQATFEAALSNFQYGSIDLLHIDGLHTYEAVKQDFESWMPKMSDQGVVLLHDITVRKRDFGVFILWEELKSRYPHVEIQQGYGLGMLVVGQRIPQTLRLLFESPDYEQSRVIQFLERLGMWVDTREKERARDEKIIAWQHSRILELEAFVQKFQKNIFFRVYHWIKYLGRK